ncbi:hypothetical protein KCU65_g9542, partial [Aureobasidium melanogenum]
DPNTTNTSTLLFQHVDLADPLTSRSLWCSQAIKIDEANTNKSRLSRMSATKIKVRRRPSIM